MDKPDRPSVDPYEHQKIINFSQNNRNSLVSFIDVNIYLCIGALITYQHILTVVHCVNKFRSVYRETIVKLGAANEPYSENYTIAALKTVRNCTDLEIVTVSRYTQNLRFSA